MIFAWRIFQWPGPVHEAMQVSSPLWTNAPMASSARRCLKSCRVRITEPMATMFAVFSSTLEKVYDPILPRLTSNVDVEVAGDDTAVADLIESEASRSRIR